MSEIRDEHERKDDAHVTEGPQEPAAAQPAPQPAPAPYVVPPASRFTFGTVLKSSAAALLGAGLLGGLIGGGVVATVDAVTSDNHGRPSFSRQLPQRDFQDSPRRGFSRNGPNTSDSPVIPS